MNVIAVDIGHSGVKVSTEADGKVVKLAIPSFVCPAFSLSDEGEQRRAGKETVIFQDRPYFFGETARIQGQMKSPVGTYDDWIETPAHAVLLLGAIKKAAAAGADVTHPILVLGLPTHLFSQQKQPLKEVVARLMQTAHTMVMPQPVGPYQAMMLDEYGFSVPSRNASSQSWGVIDVGYYTTDFLVVHKGRMVEDAMGSCGGMRKAAEHFVKSLSQRGISSDIPEAEEALVSRTVRDFGQAIDVGAEVDQALAKNVAEVMDTMARLMSGVARQLDGLVVAGGGAGLLYPFIQKAHPQAVLATDSRFAVAEGMRRFGCAYRRIQASVPVQQAGSCAPSLHRSSP